MNFKVCFFKFEHGRTGNQFEIIHFFQKSLLENVNKMDTNNSSNNSNNN